MDKCIHRGNTLYRRHSPGCGTVDVFHCRMNKNTVWDTKCRGCPLHQGKDDYKTWHAPV